MNVLIVTSLLDNNLRALLLLLQKIPELNRGVTLESVPGPLLFVIYVTDIVANAAPDEVV